MIDVVESETAFRERTKSPEELYERLLPHMGSWIMLDYSIHEAQSTFNRFVGIFEGMKAKVDYHDTVELKISGEFSTLYLRRDETKISVRVGDSWKIIQPAVTLEERHRKLP